MSNTMRKLRPNDNWRIGEHESWFIDMAAEGWYLKKMGLYFAHFVRDEPKHMRYRIDVSMNKRISTEQKQLYAENGWDYVTSYSFYNVFSSPHEFNAPELHTDPAEQSYTLKELDKKFVWSAVVIICSTLLMVGMLFALWFLDGTPILALVEGTVVQQTVVTLLILFSAITSLRAAISIRTLRKALLDGKPINHRAPWRKQRRNTTILLVLLILLALFGTALPIIQLVSRETKTLPVHNTTLPIVRLADVEQNSRLIRSQSSYIRDDVDWGNRYSFNWSLLAPVQYETDENGLIPNKMWKDGSGEYTPAISTYVYQLRIPILADNLMSDLFKRYSLPDYGGKYVERDHSDFERLIVLEADHVKEVFAVKGITVMYVRYYGIAGLETLIQATASKMGGSKTFVQ